MVIKYTKVTRSDWLQLFSRAFELTQQANDLPMSMELRESIGRMETYIFGAIVFHNVAYIVYSIVYIVRRW